MPRTQIEIPYNWNPRPYQKDFWRYRRNGGTRACIIAHRRWGKDDVALHDACVSAHERKATYWHMLPEATQARKAIWEAINPHTGIRRIDEAFPPILRSTTREQEMLIKLKCGSTWQLVGSDNFNSLMGAPPAGVVFSEWALANPSAWAYVRPILAENNGWATFITTPRGHNHAEATYKLFKSEAYFAQISNAQVTGVFSQEMLDRELREYIGEYGKEYGTAIFDQEYNCSFNAAVLGAYYGYLIERLEADGRICDFEYDEAYPVHTFWDLGLGDHMAIVFAQFVAGEIRVIDFESGAGVGIEDYINIVLAKPYTYGQHYGPHDLRVRELTRGNVSRIETAAKMGLNFKIVPNVSVIDGRQAVRAVLPKCIFQAKTTEPLVSALQNYRANWDADKKTLSPQPVNDWSCHPADAFRYMAVQWKEIVSAEPKPFTRNEMLIIGTGDGKMKSTMSIRGYIEKKERQRAMED